MVSDYGPGCDGKLKPLRSFHKTPESISHRRYCAQCGGHIMISHLDLELCDVFAATLPTLKFVQALYLNYAETVLPIHDVDVCRGTNT